MRFVATILAVVWIASAAFAEEGVSLKYAFRKGETVRITLTTNGTNNVPLMLFDELKGSMVAESRTESVNVKDGAEEAVKVCKFVDFSRRHFKDKRPVMLESDKKKNEELLSLTARLVQTASGRISLHEKQEPGYDSRFVRDFGRYIAVPLPERPVKAGDKWKNPYFEKLKKTQYRSWIQVEEYEYAGKEEMDGVLCAKIVGRNFRESPMVPIVARNPDSELGKKFKDKRNWTKLSATIYFDMKAGRVVRQEIDKQHAYYDMGEDTIFTAKHVVTYSYE